MVAVVMQRPLSQTSILWSRRAKIGFTAKKESRFLSALNVVSRRLGKLFPATLKLFR